MMHSKIYMEFVQNIHYVPGFMCLMVKLEMGSYFWFDDDDRINTKLLSQ